MNTESDGWILGEDKQYREMPVNNMMKGVTEFECASAMETGWWYR